MMTVEVKDHLGNRHLMFYNVKEVIYCSMDFTLIMNNGNEKHFLKPFYSYKVTEMVGEGK